MIKKPATESTSAQEAQEYQEVYKPVVKPPLGLGAAFLTLLGTRWKPRPWPPDPD